MSGGVALPNIPTDNRKLDISIQINAKGEGIIVVNGESVHIARRGFNTLTIMTSTIQEKETLGAAIVDGMTNILPGLSQAFVCFIENTTSDHGIWQPIEQELLEDFEHLLF